MKILEINEVKSTLQITIKKILQLDLLHSGKKQGARKYYVIVEQHNACM